jgi:hypothetical protein
VSPRSRENLLKRVVRAVIAQPSGTARIYLEQLTSASYPTSPADLAYYWDMLNRLAIEADPPIASSMILDQIRKEL